MNRNHRKRLARRAPAGCAEFAPRVLHRNWQWLLSRALTSGLGSLNHEWIQSPLEQTIASFTDSPGRRRVLQEQVKGIAELAERTIESPFDRARIEARLARVREALGTKPSEQPRTSPALRY